MRIRAGPKSGGCGAPPAPRQEPPSHPLSDKKCGSPDGATAFLVEESGFEPLKAKPADLQSVPFGHLGTPPYSILKRVELVDGFEPPTC